MKWDWILLGWAAPALAAVLLTHCAGCPPPPPVPPGPDGGVETDAALDAPPAAEATCADVCAHWAELGCVEAEPTPAGATCVETCENLLSSELVDWDLGCRARVQSCAAIDRCEPDGS